VAGETSADRVGEGEIGVRGQGTRGAFRLECMVKYGTRCGRWALIVLMACVCAAAVTSTREETSEELKARLASSAIGDRPRLCVEIAQKQLDAADKLYAGDDIEKAQTTLTEVSAYSEMARDYAIQSHKYEKQTEIAVRAMTRKLNDLLHSLGREDQAAVKEVLTRLQRVRDDLLGAMFHKK